MEFTPSGVIKVVVVVVVVVVAPVSQVNPWINSDDSWAWNCDLAYHPHCFSPFWIFWLTDSKIMYYVIQWRNDVMNLPIVDTCTSWQTYSFQEFFLVVKYSYDHRKFSVIMIVSRGDRSFSHVTCVMKPKSGQSWWRKNHVEVSRLLSVALEPLIHETNELELIIMGTSLTLKFIWRHLQLQPHIIVYGPFNMGNKKLLITIS